MGREVKVGKSQMRGGKMYRAIFGGETYYKSAPSKTTFGGLRKWDLSGVFPFLQRIWHFVNKWGGKRIIARGVQNRFGGGVLWYVLPSPEFSTPPCFSLGEKIQNASREMGGHEVARW